jgi:sporulation protein YlmC with PRC-barrel domain
MSVDPQHIRVGMEVFGDDGELVGTVKSVSDGVFELNRPWARDLIVPVEAIRAIVDDVVTHAVHPQIVLVMRAHSIDAQGWAHAD